MHEQAETALQTEETALSDGVSEEEVEEADNDLFSLELSEEDHDDSELYDESENGEFNPVESSSEESIHTRQSVRSHNTRYTHQSDVWEDESLDLVQSEINDRTNRASRTNRTSRTNRANRANRANRSNRRRQQTEGEDEEVELEWKTNR